MHSARRAARARARGDVLTVRIRARGVHGLPESVPLQYGCAGNLARDPE